MVLEPFNIDVFRRLTPNEQAAEIEREEGVLEGLKAQEVGILESQQMEEAVLQSKRERESATLIRQRAVEVQISAEEAKLQATEEAIANAETRLASISRRMFPSIIDRAEAAMLRRRVPRLRGWVTRRTSRIADLQSELDALDAELEGLRGSIRIEEERLKDKLSRLEDTRKDVEEEEKRLKEKREQYNIVEYTRYYKYKNDKRPSWYRHFEARLTINIPTDIAPEDLKDFIAKQMDDIIEGFLSGIIFTEKEWVSKGFEVKGTDTQFRRPQELELEDKARRQYGVWRCGVPSATGEILECPNISEAEIRAEAK